MLYTLGKTVCYIVYKTLYRLRIEGSESVPAGTGLIIASNHNSYADPPLVGASLKRPVYFMAKKELFEVPVFGWLISRMHAYPVNRNSPEPSSIKKTIKMLRGGKAILIFPEGSRKNDTEIHRGISLLAHKAGVPVLPSRIVNNNNLHRFPKLRYVIGKPLKFPAEPSARVGSEKYSEFAHRIMDNIRALG